MSGFDVGISVVLATIGRCFALQRYMPCVRNFFKKIIECFIVKSKRPRYWSPAKSAEWLQSTDEFLKAIESGKR